MSWEGSVLTRHFLYSLGAVMLLGCGDMEPRAGMLEGSSTVEQAVDVPGTHGYEIELPIWNFSYVPAEWETYAPENVGWLIHNRAGSSRATMDWGGGNALYGVMTSHYPYLGVSIAPGSGHAAIGHITGLSNQVQRGLVRGSVEMEMSPGTVRPEVGDDFVLALQARQASGWQDVVTKSLSRDVFFYGEVQAVLPPNTEVRLEIRMRKLPNSYQDVSVLTARLFGAQCYPDFANPGSCL